MLADGAGEAELPAGVGSGDEVAADGLLAGDGLSVADPLVVGEGLLVGAAEGDVAGELADDGCAVGAAAWIGSVVPAAELGNSVITGSGADTAC